MNSLPATTDVHESIPGTFAAYEPLLEASRENILSTPREQHQYGPHPRQWLDIYGSEGPLLVWVYGGGLTGGSRRLSELVYANLGHFFSKWFMVAVVDYRLVPEAKYPSGGEDVALALKWLERYNREIYLIGNSAGGVHVATCLFEWTPVVRKTVFLSVPLDMEDAAAGRDEVNRKYWGDDLRTPDVLLKDVGVKMLAVGCEKDPDEILKPLERFVALGKEKGVKIDKMMIEKHNHVSTFLALGTGIEEEEEWGRRVVEWLLQD